MCIRDRPILSIDRRVSALRNPFLRLKPRLGLNLKIMSLGPRRCSTTVAVTAAGFTSSNCAPSSPEIRTASSSTVAPSSAVMRSTTSSRPTSARYCFPPISTMANIRSPKTRSIHLHRQPRPPGGRKRSSIPRPPPSDHYDGTAALPFRGRPPTRVQLRVRQSSVGAIPRGLFDHDLGPPTHDAGPSEHTHRIAVHPRDAVTTVVYVLFFHSHLQDLSGDHRKRRPHDDLA